MADRFDCRHGTWRPICHLCCAATSNVPSAEGKFPSKESRDAVAAALRKELEARRADDIVTRLQCIYDPVGCGQCTFCLAKDEIECLRSICANMAHDLTCIESHCTLCGDGLREWREHAKRIQSEVSKLQEEVADTMWNAITATEVTNEEE